jgi:hypothetical protein
VRPWLPALSSLTASSAGRWKTGSEQPPATGPCRREPRRMPGGRERLPSWAGEGEGPGPFRAEPPPDIATIRRWLRIRPKLTHKPMQRSGRVTSGKVDLAGQWKPSPISLESCASLAAIGRAIFGHSDEPSAAGLMAPFGGNWVTRSGHCNQTYFFVRPCPCDHFLHVS